VDTALIVAASSGAVALASAGFAWRAQLAVTDRQAQRDQEAREEERRSQAKVILDQFRGPLLDAAWELGDRIDHIRNRRFLDYRVEGSGREQDAKLTTLFRFAHYFGWREVVRTQVQLLRFENEEDTRLVAGLLGDLSWVLSSDRLDESRAMLWSDEQRGIGELMVVDRDGTPPAVRGHAAFHRDYDDLFAPWMERFAQDLLTPAVAQGDRLRLLHWALLGVVRLLDEERAYEESGWTDRAAAEIPKTAPPVPTAKTEARLRDHLAVPGVL
jgi:hypothetical protein